MTRTTEKRNPVSVGIDEKPIAEILAIINSEDKKITEAIQKELPHIEEAVKLIISSLEKGRNIYIVGAGTSGRLGVLEASEIPPTFGLSPDRIRGVIAGGDRAIILSVEAAEDDRTRGGAKLEELGIGSGDLVIGVTASGSTPYVLGAVETARLRGAKTVGVSCNSDTVLSGLVDAPIEVIVEPEIVAGSTRMKSGTAQKMVLNMMTTAAMMKLGLVYDGYMVGVQATNQKLKERSTRMVSDITGVDSEEALRALEAAGWDVRVALCHIQAGLTPEEAAERLKTQTIREIIGEEK
jgi:N-acetylmuramic acid 6-phosphate etherase